MDMGIRLGFASQVADGMAHLESRGIVHGVINRIQIIHQRFDFGECLGAIMQEGLCECV